MKMEMSVGGVKFSVISHCERYKVDGADVEEAVFAAKRDNIRAVVDKAIALHCFLVGHGLSLNLDEGCLSLNGIKDVNVTSIDVLSSKNMSFWIMVIYQELGYRYHFESI